MRGDMAMFKMERKNFSEGKTNRKKKIICISAVILIALFAGIIFLVSNGIKLYQNKIANAENIQALSTKTPLTATNKITGSGFSDVWDIAKTPDGGYVAIASYSGECDVDGDGKVDYSSPLKTDSLLIKYNASSEIEWSTCVTSQDPNGGEYKSVSVSPDGTLYYIGGYEQSSGQGIVRAVDKEGNLTSFKYIVTSSSSTSRQYPNEIKDVYVLSNGNIVALCRFSSAEVSDGKNTTSNIGENNGYLVCMDSKANVKWSIPIQGTGDIEPTSVTETSKGIAISVNYVGNVNISGKVISNTGAQDSAIVAYSLDGTYQWNLPIAGTNNESITKIITDTNDNIVAVGGTASSDITQGQMVPPNTTENSSGLAVILSNTGEFQSGGIIGGTDGDDKLISVAPTSDGGFLIAGWYYSTTGFGLTGNWYNAAASFSNNGENEGIITKVSKNHVFEWHKTINGSSYDTVYAVEELKSGAMVVGGSFDSSSLTVKTCTWNGTETSSQALGLSAQGYNDAFLLTYSDAKPTSVLVHHYKEGTTEKVSEDVTINGKVDDAYATSAATDIPEYYELVSTPTNASGTMTDDQITVTYYYKLKSYLYTVRYLEKIQTKY